METVNKLLLGLTRVRKSEGKLREGIQNGMISHTYMIWFLCTWSYPINMWYDFYLHNYITN